MSLPEGFLAPMVGSQKVQNGNVRNVRGGPARHRDYELFNRSVTRQSRVLEKRSEVVEDWRRARASNNDEEGGQSRIPGTDHMCGVRLCNLYYQRGSHGVITRELTKGTPHLLCSLSDAALDDVRGAASEEPTECP
jgi:hypothetical protein